jgi:hypothetical protein
LRRLFETQVALDLSRELPSARPEIISSLTAKIHSCVIRIFSDRGGELADASFGGCFEAPSSMDEIGGLIGVHSTTTVAPNPPKLESTKGPVDVVVIDHISKAAEN